MKLGTASITKAELQCNILDLSENAVIECVCVCVCVCTSVTKYHDNEDGTSAAAQCDVVCEA